MLRIYSDEVLEQRLRNKRGQMLFVFFAGMLAGLALTQLGVPLSEASAQMRTAKPAHAEAAAPMRTGATCLHQRATQATPCTDARPRLPLFAVND